MAAANASPVPPVYVTARALPQYEALPTTYDVCVAAEAVSGRGTIRGAQRIRGLWTIYPKHKESRDKLLLEGFMFRGARVSLLDQNPFTNRDQGEQPTTKLWISNIPLSVDNTDIESALRKIGVELRSTLRYELARNPDGRLTSFETGRRFVFVTIPKTPLLPVLKIGHFSAGIYYKEQSKKIKCSKCLQDNHRAANCVNDIVCMGCLQAGHRKADCPTAMPENDERNTQPAGEGEGGEGCSNTAELAVQTASQPAVPHRDGEHSVATQPQEQSEKETEGLNTKHKATQELCHNPAPRGATNEGMPSDRREKRERSESPQAEQQTKRLTVSTEGAEKEESEMEEGMGGET